MGVFKNDDALDEAVDEVHHEVAAVLESAEQGLLDEEVEELVEPVAEQQQVSERNDQVCLDDLHREREELVEGFELLRQVLRAAREEVFAAEPYLPALQAPQQLRLQFEVVQHGYLLVAVVAEVRDRLRLQEVQFVSGVHLLPRLAWRRTALLGFDFADHGAV